MGTVRALPYRQAGDDCFTSDPWVVELSGQQRQLDGSLPDWDAATRVQLARHIRVDLDGVREACGLPPEARLSLGAFWRCKGTTLRGEGSRHRFQARDQAQERLGIDIPGHLLAGEVDLHVALTLAGPLERAPLRAHRPGSVLWEERQAVQLEGGGARFPMELRSFSKSSWRLPDGAAWFLDLESEEIDWDASVLAGMRLHLNSDHPIKDWLVSEAGGEGGRLMQETLLLDVGRQLLRAALSCERFLEREERWRRGSLGDAVSRLLRQRFRGESKGTLATLMRQEPGVFEARLQGALGVWSQEVP